MRVISHSQHGDPDVLQLSEREPALPGPGEVRVRIAVSGVNPTDWKNRRGAPTGVQDATEWVPNQDGAGVVEAVGPGVEGLSTGDRVWVMMAAAGRPLSGTAQELTVLPAERVVPLPEAASFDVGASLGVPAVTAHRALTVSDGGPYRLAPGALAGRTVLVPGGAGAVGHAAIQLARWAGATVISTVSSEAKEQLARAAGAQHVLRYPDPELAAAIRSLAPDGVDIVVEVAAAANAGLDLAVLAPGGTVAVYGNDRGAEVQLDFFSALMTNSRWQFVLLYTGDPAAVQAAAVDVSAAAAAGALAVGAPAGLPLHRFPLEQTAQAQGAVEHGVTGKVLIDVADLG